jgi:hypothetical protein
LPKLVPGCKKAKNACSAEMMTDQIFFNICNNEESTIRILFMPHHGICYMLRILTDYNPYGKVLQIAWYLVTLITIIPDP